MISQQLLVLHWGQVKQELNIRGSRVAATSRRTQAQTTARRAIGRAKLRKARATTPKRDV